MSELAQGNANIIHCIGQFECKINKTQCKEHAKPREKLKP